MEEPNASTDRTCRSCVEYVNYNPAPTDIPCIPVEMRCVIGEYQAGAPTIFSDRYVRVSACLCVRVIGGGGGGGDGVGVIGVMNSSVFPVNRPVN